jgi:hypothetical protein
MLTYRGRQLLWRKPEGYAATHCRNCKGGWVREGKEGELVVCKLDGEPVLAEMTKCSEFDRKDEA